MSIVGSLPDNLQNGTTADASQVMADLNFIVNQVNANAMPAVNTTFPTLTVEAGAFVIDGAAATNRAALMSTAGTNRWFAGADAVPESGSSAGSNYEIIPYNDAGVQQTTALTLTRSTGNAVFGAGVTVNSDERLKDSWELLPSDFIEQLSQVKSGTYRRTDLDARHAGVSAQALLKILPEAVIEDSRGMLAVAYGNAALVACVELAKEVMRLRALLEPVK